MSNLAWWACLSLHILSPTSSHSTLLFSGCSTVALVSLPPSDTSSSSFGSLLSEGPYPRLTCWPFLLGSHITQSRESVYSMTCSTVQSSGLSLKPPQLFACLFLFISVFVLRCKVQEPRTKELRTKLDKTTLSSSLRGACPRQMLSCHCTGEKCKFPAANTRHRNTNFGSVHRFLLQDCEKESSSSQLYFKEASQGASSLPGTMVTWAEKPVGSGRKLIGHRKRNGPVLSLVQVGIFFRRSTQRLIF